jgi:putative (di)nucleoside polyphosphate hydrolase
VIDSHGFRANVGIILINGQGQVFWARRTGQNAWQFPQGGIERDESPEEAVYRELAEEVGLAAQDVELIGQTGGWLRYHLPQHLIRKRSKPLCIGQKQRWFVMRLMSAENRVRLDAVAKPEFDHWRWISYWRPMQEVVFFKRRVYRLALQELAPLVFPGGAPAQPARRHRHDGAGAAAEPPKRQRIAALHPRPASHTTRSR